jgi:heme/copper-type cytochrome/quinol oxidase subunit 2
MWIVIGVVLAVLAVFVLVVYSLRKNRREEKIWEE